MGDGLTPKDVIAEAQTGRLAGQSLAGLKLSKADLRAAKLRKIAAAGINLRKAVLRDADLAGADLAGADLREADFTGADLSGADLRRAKVNQADFTGAKLVDVKAGEAIFDKAVFRDADLSGADISYAVLRAARLERTKLIRANLTGTDAGETIAVDVDLSGAELRESAFRECRFERVRAAEMSAPAADFSFAEIKAADFSRASLPAARFFGAILKNVNFAGADLAEALFNRSQHQAVAFDGANLDKALFKGVYGILEKDLRAMQERGALIDLFLFRRFLRLLWRSLAVKIAVAAILVAVFVSAYRFFADPYHWSYEVLHGRAQKLYERGELERAVALERVIIEKYAGDRDRIGEAKLSIASHYAQRGQRQTALAMLQEIAAAFDGDRESAQALEMIAGIYEQWGDSEKARAAYQRLREADAGNPETEAKAEFGLAELLKKDGRDEEALAKYRTVFEKFRFDLPTGNRALLEAIRLLCQFDRLDEAVETLARLDAYDSSSNAVSTQAMAATAVAEAFRRRGDWAAAEREYRAVYDKYDKAPQSVDAGATLAELYREQGKIPEAEALFAEMAQRATTDEKRGQLILAHVRLLFETGQTQKALALLQAKVRDIKDARSRFEADMLLLTTYAGDGDLPAAEALYVDMIATFRRDRDRLVDAKRAMSRIYIAKGMTDPAASILRELIAHSSRPDVVGSAMADLADLYSRSGATEKAARIYRELADARDKAARADREKYEKGNPAEAYAAGLMLADALRTQGKIDEAVALLVGMEKRWPSGSQRTEILKRRVAALEESGRGDEALVLLREAAPQFEDREDRSYAALASLDLLVAAGNTTAAEQVRRSIYEDPEQDAAARLHADRSMARGYANQGFAEKAEAIYRQILADHPETSVGADAKWELAELYRKTGDLPKAALYYGELRSDPFDPDRTYRAGLSLADTLAEQNSFAEARAVLEDLNRKWSADERRREELVLARSRLLRRAGSPDAAAALLRTELPSFRDVVSAGEALSLLLDIYSAAGDVDQAEQVVQLAGTPFKGFPEQLAKARLSLGRLFAGHDLLDRAAKTFGEIIARYPHTDAALEARDGLGDLHRRRGDLASAEKTYRQLAECQPDAAKAFQAAAKVLEILLEQEKYTEADKLLEEMRRKWTGRPDQKAALVMLRVDLLRRQNRIVDAIAILRQALPSFDEPEKRAEASVALMDLCALRGDINGAEVAFREAIETSVTDPRRVWQMKQSLAEACLGHDQAEKGVALYREIVEKCPDEKAVSEARWRLAGIWRTRGETAEAVEQLHGLLAAGDPAGHAVEAGVSLAEILAGERQFDQADAVLAELENRAALRPADRAEIVFRRAELLKQQQQYDSAIAVIVRELPNIADPQHRMEAMFKLLDLHLAGGDVAAADQTRRGIRAEFPKDIDALLRANAMVADFYAAQGQADKADSLSREIIAEFPRSTAATKARVKLAERLRKSGDLVQAEKLLREALAVADDADEAVRAGTMLADILEEQNSYGEAQKVFALLRQKWSADPARRAEIALRQAELLRRAGDPAAETALLRAELPAIRDTGKFVELSMRLIGLYVVAGEIKSAEAVFLNVAQALHGDAASLASAQVDLAKIYAENNLEDRAMAIYAEVIAQRPRTDAAARARSELAASYRRRGDAAKAERAYRELFESARDETQAMQATTAVVEILAEQKKYAEADRQLAAMLKKWGDRPAPRAAILMYRGDLHRQQNRYDEAIADLRQALPLLDDPGKRAEASVALIEVYGSRGDIKGAENAFDEAVRASADDPGRVRQIKLSLAETCVRHEQFEKGAALLRDIIAKHPDARVVADARWSLAGALRERGDDAGAKAQFQQLLAEPDPAGHALDAGFALADILIGEQAFEQAASVYADLAKRPALRPTERTDLVFRRAALLRQRRQFDAAIALVVAEIPKIVVPEKRLEATFKLLELQLAAGNFGAADQTRRGMRSEFARDVDAQIRADTMMADLYVAQGQMEKANAAFREIVARYPNAGAAAQARLDLADRLRSGGDLAQAAALLREALAQANDPEIGLRAGLTLADVLEDQQSFGEAQKVYEFLRGKWSNDASRRSEIVLREANALERAGQPAAQMALLRAELPALRTSEKFVETSLRLSELYVAAGDVKSAEAVFQNAAQSLRGDPAALAQAQVDLAKIYADKGLDDRAAALYAAVVAKFPRTDAAARAKRELASWQRRKGELGKAEQAYRELADGERDAKRAYDLAATVVDILVEQKKFREADGQLTAMLRRFGAQPDLRAATLLKRASVDRQQGRNSEALAAVRQALPLLPDAQRQADAAVSLMELCVDAGDVKGAEAAFKQATEGLASDPDRFWSLKLSLANLYVGHGQFEKGAVVFREILATHAAKFAGDAALGLAAALRDHGDRAAAQKLLRETLSDNRLASHAVAAGDQLADMLIADKQFAEADAIYAGLLSRVPRGSADHVDVVFRRAQLLATEKKFPAAIALLNPEFPQLTTPAQRVQGYVLLLQFELAQDDLAAMDATYRAAVKNVGGDPKSIVGLQVWLGQRYVGQGLPDKAQPLFIDAAARDPHGDGGQCARLELGNTYRDRGDFAKAAATFSALLDEPPSNWTLNGGLSYAAMLAEQNRGDEVEKIVARLRAQWPNKGGERDVIDLRHADFLQRLKQPARAAALLETALKDFDDRGRLYEGYCILIAAHKAAGDSGKAAAAFAAVQKVFRDEPDKIAHAKDVLTAN